MYKTVLCVKNKVKDRAKEQAESNVMIPFIKLKIYVR